jgi:hypothetical protein
VFVVLDDQLVFPYTGTSGVSPSGKRGMYTGVHRPATLRATVLPRWIRAQTGT